MDLFTGLEGYMLVYGIAFALFLILKGMEVQ